MDMADTGLAVSGTAFGAIATVAVAYLRSRASGSRRAQAVRATLEPDPLRVELQETFATKHELRELEDRMERKLDKTLEAIREDVAGLRQDIKENDMRAEARSVATHKRIDGMKDICAMRGRSCK